MPVLHYMAVSSHGNLRTWMPEQPEVIAERLTLAIWPKGQKESDYFSLRLATPKGLATLGADGGVISGRALLVIDKYSYATVYSWLQQTVGRCDGDSWLECVTKLERYFWWEYDGYNQS